MVKNRSNASKQPKKGRKRTEPRQVSKTSLAINTKTRNVAPRILSSSVGTVVSHREILMDSVSVSPTFSITSTVSAQPGISTYSHGSPLGTWLPKVAGEYDMYCFESLKVHFTTSASSLQKGTVFIGFDPNPDSSAPASFSDLRNMAYAVTGPARENLVLDVTPIVSGKKLLTRTRAVTSYPNYDVGRFFLGSTLGDGAAVGYYEVEYKVRLLNPQTSPSTELINISSTPPAVIFTDDGSANIGPLYFGTTNAARCANAMANYLLRLNPLGDTSLITLNNPLSIYPTAGSVVVGGVTYSWGANVNATTFRFAYPGRYRIIALINGDWQDYAMYGASILKAGSTLSAASDRTVTTSGISVDIPVVPGSWRGFSNPTTPADDGSAMIDQTVAVPDVSQSYTFAVGVRNVASIAENANATYYSAPATVGSSYIRIEYIGALSSE